MGDVEQLKAEFAASTDPARRLELVKQMGELFLSQGQLADARRAFEAASKFAPNDLAAINGARRVISLLDPRAALDWFDRELKLISDDAAKARVYKTLGELYQNKLNDFENAQTAFGLARQADPGVFNEPAPAPALPSLDALEPLPDLPALAPPPPGPGAAPATAAPAPGPVPPPTVPAVRSLGGVRSAQRAAPTRKAPLVVAALLVVIVGAAVASRQFAVAERPAAVQCDADLVRRPDDPAHPDEQIWDCVGKLTTTRWILSSTRVIERAQVANGRLEGEAVRMPSPDVRIEGGYVDGAPSGVWRTLRNDVLESDEVYVKGKRNGRAHRFGLDGGVVEEQEWADDSKHGEFASYSAAGKVLLTGRYERNAKSGKWTRFDQQGRAVEVWREPRGESGKADAGKAIDDLDSAGPEVAVEELYAGQTLANWRIRHAEVRLEAKQQGDRTLEELVVRRAQLAGLKLNAEGTLEPAK